MLVYRLEDSNGKGVYRSGCYKEVCNLTDYQYFKYERGVGMRYWDALKKYGDSVLQPEQPSPVESGLIGSTKLRKYHQFAFPSVESAKRWFTPTELFLIDKCGFSLNIYKVNSKSAYVDNFQVAYDKRSARLVDSVGGLYDESEVNHFLIAESLYWCMELGLEFDCDKLKEYLRTITPISPITGMSFHC